MRASILIIFWCMMLAIGYGIVHDQITARICVEYFTIGHPRLIESESPTELGVFWGIVATWWAGAILGILIAIAARAGRRTPWPAARVVKQTLILSAVMAACAVATAIAARELAMRGIVHLLPPLDSRVPVEKHVAFITAGGAHVASYAVGFIGGVVLAVWIWRARRLEIHEGAVA
jgi:hypothetical protein